MPKHRDPSFTVGIDLAAQPRHTAAVMVEWTHSGSRVARVHEGLDDAAVLALAREERVAKVGIDAPFGWPQPFAEALRVYARTARWPAIDRRKVAFRSTDLYVREATGRWPLSVSTNFIAYVAIRCAALLTELLDGDLDRTGAGLVVEVYPAAALRAWNLPAMRYKGQTEESGIARRELVAEILRAADGALLVSEDDRLLLETSDHTLDAFVAALVARATQAGEVRPIPPALRGAAEIEGWIHLPSGLLARLLAK